jgi:hypothetical protein
MYTWMYFHYTIVTYITLMYSTLIPEPYLIFEKSSELNWGKYAALFYALMYLQNQKFETLKVPSGQISSAWEWYYWIGLWKNINR